MDIAGSGVLEVVAEYESHRLGQEVDGETYLKADASWFRSIVAGVVRDQTKIDPLIRQALQTIGPCRAWTARCAPSCVPALRIDRAQGCAHRGHSNGICRDRSAFFPEDEPRLVNAVLDRIAKQVRAPAQK